jgi:glycosyltransferase involved in cell wall biosynthesis
MRILRIAQKLYPDVTGGGAYHVHAMSRDQAAAGHDVTVLTVAQEGHDPGLSEQAGYTVIRCRALVEVLGNTISPDVARHLRRTGEYDVIHAHSHLYFSTNLAALGTTFSETPLALTNHGLYSQSAPEWLFDAYLRTVGRWTFNAADVVFCYSETDRDRLRELGINSDIDIVANGIDVNRFTPEGPASDHIGPDAPAILFVGRLTDGKRPADAIKALARVREDYPNACLYLAGDGECRETLEDLVTDRGLGDWVSFLGHVDYDEMPRLYRAADVLLLPSRAEGMPRTVLEALATETPVVTSDLPQLRSLTDTAGHAVPIGDIDGLATSLATVLSDPERAEAMGKRGRKRVTERYTWSDTVRETTERLEALVET